MSKLYSTDEVKHIAYILYRWGMEREQLRLPQAGWGEFHAFVDALLRDVESVRSYSKKDNTGDQNKTV